MNWREDYEIKRFERVCTEKGRLTPENTEVYIKLAEASASIDDTTPKLQHVAEAIQYLYTPEGGAISRYIPPELYDRKHQVFDLAGVHLEPLTFIHWRDMSADSRLLALNNLNPEVSGFFTDNEVAAFSDAIERRYMFWTLDEIPKPLLDEEY